MVKRTVLDFLLAPYTRTTLGFSRQLWTSYSEVAWFPHNKCNISFSYIDFSL